MTKKQTKTLCYLVWLSFIFLTSCGSINSFSTKNSILSIPAGTVVYINSLDCNENKCISKNNTLHSKLKNVLEESFRSKGIIVTDSITSADYEFLLISAHEQEIQNHLPRNIHLIVRDKSNVELSQFGASEDFSTPMTEEYLDVASVTSKFQEHVDSLLSTNLFAENIKK